MQLSKRVFQVVFPAVLGGLLFLLNLEREEWMLAALFVGGMYLGQTLLFLDETLFHKWYHESGVQAGLLTRSTLFILTYPLLVLYLLTSSGSIFGIGVVLGVGTALSAEMLELRSNPTAFSARFLRQLKREVSAVAIERTAVGFAVFVLFVSVASIL